jgi:site-specific recombinase XerD
VKFEKLLERIQQSPQVRERNKELIVRYFAHLRLAKPWLAALTLQGYGEGLYRFGRLAEVDFETATKADFEDLLRKAQGEGWSKGTYSVWLLALKIFLKWVKYGRVDRADPYPPEIAWAKTPASSTRVLPENLLSPDDVRRLVEAATSLEHKALISALYESGCRIGEMLGLSMASVRFDDYGAVLMVRGKTGQRRIRVIAASPLLARWMDEHPMKDDPSAPVWVSRYRAGWKVMSVSYLNKLLKKVGRRAGLPQPEKIHAHLLRHSRATQLAKSLTEQQLKVMFGWSGASAMAAKYVHLSGADVDDALLTANGLKRREEERPAFIPMECPRCKEKASPGQSYCYRCGTPLEPSAAARGEALIEENEKLLEKLLQDPEVVKVLLRRLAALIPSLSASGPPPSASPAG